MKLLGRATSPRSHFNTIRHGDFDSNWTSRSFPYRLAISTAIFLPSASYAIALSTSFRVSQSNSEYADETALPRYRGRIATEETRVFGDIWGICLFFLANQSGPLRCLRFWTRERGPIGIRWDIAQRETAARDPTEACGQKNQ
jgi:hypothetical protein